MPGSGWGRLEAARELQGAVWSILEQPGPVAVHSSAMCVPCRVSIVGFSAEASPMIIQASPNSRDFAIKCLQSFKTSL